MNVPAISVLMSVYNAAPYLAASIESILAQSFGDFEFLILNDGSDDGSQEILNRFAGADARIRVIHQDNRGLVDSLNRLVAESRAPILARMDADDVALPTRFERQLGFMRDNPTYGVVGAWVSCIGIDGGPQETVQPDYPTNHEDFLAALETRPLLCHPTVMMRRELVLEAGGYRSAFRHCEDYDLWLRLSERTRLCSLPERLLLYRRSGTQVSSRYALEQQIGAAIAWLAHLERLAGRSDPTQSLRVLPPLRSLDALFGRAGITRAAVRRVAPRIIYSPGALRGEGYQILLDYVRDGGTREGMWRTAARLVKLREPRRAIGFARALTFG